MLGLKLDVVLTDKDVPCLIKDLVQKLKDNGNITVGPWVRDMSLVDLLSVQKMSRMARDSAHYLLGDGQIKADGIGDIPFVTQSMFYLLIDILSQGEGLELEVSSEEMAMRAVNFDNLIETEILIRKGFSLKLEYDKISISAESGPKDYLKVPEISVAVDQVVQALAATGMKVDNKDKDGKELSPEEFLNKVSGEIQTALETRLLPKPGEDPWEDPWAKIWDEAQDFEAQAIEAQTRAFYPDMGSAEDFKALDSYFSGLSKAPVRDEVEAEVEAPSPVIALGDWIRRFKRRLKSGESEI